MIIRITLGKLLKHCEAWAPDQLNPNFQKCGLGRQQFVKLSRWFRRAPGSRTTVLAGQAFLKCRLKHCQLNLNQKVMKIMCCLIAY